MADAGRIVLVLSSIDDFYSSFDDRPYGERDLSRNLIAELLRKAEAGEVSEVEFRVRGRFGEKDGETVKMRLAEYFSKEEERVRKEQWTHRFKGTAYVVIGGALLVAQNRLGPTGYEAVGILLLPAGWFSIFLGAEHIIADWRLRPRQEALKKIKNADYSLSRSK